MQSDRLSGDQNCRVYGCPLQALAARDAALERKENVADALQQQLAQREAELQAAAAEAEALQQQVQQQLVLIFNTCAAHAAACAPLCIWRLICTMSMLRALLQLSSTQAHVQQLQAAEDARVQAEAALAAAQVGQLHSTCRQLRLVTAKTSQATPLLLLCLPFTPALAHQTCPDLPPPSPISHHTGGPRNGQ